MNPGLPEPNDPHAADPFADVVDDDEGVDWVDEPNVEPEQDIFAVVEDTDGTESLTFDEAAPAPELPAIDDEGGTDEFALDQPSDEFDNRVNLPWRTTARVNGTEVPAILSPSMPRSTWRGGPTDRQGEPVRIEIGPLSLDLVVDIVEGAPTLVLGRDVLEGRIRIEV